MWEWIGPGWWRWSDYVYFFMCYMSELEFVRVHVYVQVNEVRVCVRVCVFAGWWGRVCAAETALR